MLHRQLTNVSTLISFRKSPHAHWLLTTAVCKELRSFSSFLSVHHTQSMNQYDSFRTEASRLSSFNIPTVFCIDIDWGLRLTQLRTIELLLISHNKGQIQTIQASIYAKSMGLHHAYQCNQSSDRTHSDTSNRPVYQSVDRVKSMATSCRRIDCAVVSHLI